MASYEDYLKKKLKQGKQPLSYEAWAKKVGVIAEISDAEIKVEAGPDGEEGTIDDVVTFVPSEESVEAVTVVEADEPTDEEPVKEPVEEPAEDLRSPKEKKRDSFLDQFWAAKRG